MPSSEVESPDESFFNDLSQQVPNSSENRPSPHRSDSQDGQKDDGTNKPKRMACVLCRKRKLRCDGVKPTCGTCKRLTHDCAYDEVRKKSGPKRGYVKLLEARLQQVETLLKNQESTEQNKNASQQDSASAYVASTIQQRLTPSAADRSLVSFSEGISPGPDTFQANGSANAHATDGDFSWEMIGLGLEEPLPPQDVMNDLYQIYFAKIHPSIPVIHKPRFLAAMNLAPHMRPPVCLRYIMWTMAASVTDKYDGLQEHFYGRARKYAQMDELRGHGESTITLGHCQAWIIIATYEFKQMYFPRAWLSTGRGVRLAQMMQLHRLDGAGLDVKQCLAPPKDWTEREERRRTFWLAFCVDRYASIGTGWPMTIDEQDILTNLPASEEAFEKSKAMSSTSLAQAMQPGGSATLEPLGGVILTAALFGRNLLHLHRPGPDERDDDVNGGFWTRHRQIESILLNVSLSLPDHLRLPSGLPDPNVVFLNMAVHTSVICLHQAAIFKADKYRLPMTHSNESKRRCVTAAAEIASAMRMISHLDLSAMNPFISFCVYVAARVFVQYLKTRPKDPQMNSSLQFLLQAMQALRRRNPLTESFLVQLDLDLEAAGIMAPELKRPVPSNAPAYSTGGMSGNLHNSDPYHDHPNFPTSAPAGSKRPCRNIFEVQDNEPLHAPINPSSGAESSTQRPASQFTTEATPGPPFYASNVTINMEPQHVPFVPSQRDNQMSLPGRERPSSDLYQNTAFTLPEDNEMDISADDRSSPTTTNSQSKGGSTSGTSYSPAGQNEMHPVANNSTAFFQSNDDLFVSGFYNTGEPMPGNTIPNGFLMTNDWDMSAMAAGTTGMAPMESTWDSHMLDSIALGWDSMGPPHPPPAQR